MFGICDGITVLPWESNDVVFVHLDCQAKTTAEFNWNLVILASPDSGELMTSGFRQHVIFLTWFPVGRNKATSGSTPHLFVDIYP